MALVAAKCTQCGANIEVDETKEAGICKFCGTAFVTEKVINHYNNTINIKNATINIEGANINNLLLRASQFELNGEFETAKQYYNRVLDIDANNPEALLGVQRLSCFILGVKVSAKDISRIDAQLPNNKIKAISIVREITGAELKEAKDFIDQYRVGLTPTEISKIKAKSSDNISQNGCYIATSVYGSYDCPQVWTLRRYRDDSLSNKWYGKLFIHIYYAISPKIVKLFGNKKWFNKIFKRFLDKKIYKLKIMGFKDTPYKDNYR